MDGFERRSEEKRQEIRETASELFRTHGIRRVTVREIAAEAGVSPVTIYNYFGSKRGLVRDVIQWVMSQAVDEFTSLLHGEEPFLVKLSNIFSRKSGAISTYHADMINTILSQDPSIRGFVEELMQDYQREVERFMEQGKREGYISPDLPMRVLLAYMEVYRQIAYARPDLFSDMTASTDMLKQFTRLFLYGLLGKEEYPELLESLDQADTAGA